MSIQSDIDYINREKERIKLLIDRLSSYRSLDLDESVVIDTWRYPVRTAIYNTVHGITGALNTIERLETSLGQWFYQQENAAHKPEPSGEVK